MQTVLHWHFLSISNLAPLYSWNSQPLQSLHRLESPDLAYRPSSISVFHLLCYSGLWSVCIRPQHRSCRYFRTSCCWADHCCSNATGRCRTSCSSLRCCSQACCCSNVTGRCRSLDSSLRGYSLCCCCLKKLRIYHDGRLSLQCCSGCCCCSNPTDRCHSCCSTRCYRRCCSDARCCRDKFRRWDNLLPR